MGTRNPLPSERNRNLDFTILNKEAVGPAFLVLNLERTRGGDRDSLLPRMWAAQFAVNPFFFFFLLHIPNYNSLVSIGLNAL